MKKKAKTRTTKSRAGTRVQPIPKGYQAVIPYLMLKGAGRAIDFYKQALGASERLRIPGPGGLIGHAELKIGDCIIMLADESPGSLSKSPQTLGGSPIGFALYVKNADESFHRAVKAGATVKLPLENKFYGDRSGTVEDPFGYIWTFMTHVEDVSMEEMNRRMQKNPQKSV